jgi:hypothetical protein
LSERLDQLVGACAGAVGEQVVELLPALPGRFRVFAVWDDLVEEAAGGGGAHAVE